MSIYITASSNHIVFHFDDYFSQIPEVKQLLENLSGNGFSIEHQTTRNFCNNIDDKPVLLLSMKLTDIYEKGIVNFLDFENRIMFGFKKTDSQVKNENQPGLTFFYRDSLGKEENRKKYEEESAALYSKLDEENCDLMNWFIHEEMLKKYEVKSDDYLKTFFHEENNKRFIACAQGNLPSKGNSSSFMFLPIELMLKITGYVDPLYPQEGEKVFDDVKMKRNNKMEISSSEEDSYTSSIEIKKFMP